MNQKYYQIDEVSKITDLTKRSIRYYEDMGLFTPTARTDSGYRMYSDEDISTINEIKELRSKLGLTIPEVKQILGLRKILNKIWSKDITDKEHINEALEKVNTLVETIDEREKILRRVKDNCNNSLNRLITLLNEKEEE
ncbi:helix-turn-helix domain-containing protein [Clostridium fungisolvens]|uniref:HTH-type transcriptional regulator HmrR n=1 Tax=Clostridium fungisolvens TaxID=1604897 RepID=A0A6V8SMT3_9CLOT|nr:MerR family transcriptional regulator [Clostridium fungisolvens]GFP78519.1 HTH-type transcriptional regulator HmrR [Clostridium fungisolvens]